MNEPANTTEPTIHRLHDHESGDSDPILCRLPSPNPDMQLYTVRISYDAAYSNDRRVFARDADEACEIAISDANDSDDWRSVDHCGDSYCWALDQRTIDGGNAVDKPAPIPYRHGFDGVNGHKALSNDAIATILAALRNLQIDIRDDTIDPARDFPDLFVDVPPLDLDQINALFEYMNGNGESGGL